MHYRVVIFGVKDTTAEIVRFVQEKLCPVDLVVTIHPDVLSAVFLNRTNDMIQHNRTEVNT